MPNLSQRQKKHQQVKEAAEAAFLSFEHDINALGLLHSTDMLLITNHIRKIETQVTAKTVSTFSRQLAEAYELIKKLQEYRNTPIMFDLEHHPDERPEAIAARRDLENAHARCAIVHVDSAAKMLQDIPKYQKEIELMSHRIDALLANKLSPNNPSTLTVIANNAKLLNKLSAKKKWKNVLASVLDTIATALKYFAVGGFGLGALTFLLGPTGLSQIVGASIMLGSGASYLVGGAAARLSDRLYVEKNETWKNIHAGPVNSLKFFSTTQPLSAQAQNEADEFIPLSPSSST